MTSPDGLDPAGPERGDGQLGVVERAEPGRGHDHHLGADARRRGRAAVPPSVSSRTSSPPAPSTITVSWNSASTRIRSAYSATGGIRTPRSRAAVSGASGSGRR